MSDPTRRNRLAEAESPYLRQHADNPVNWQPWDEKALKAARERDVPIFLSIGYSACHWCHVMEDESFDDEEVAAVLNDNFVPIKVDREERPDVDSIYMTVCQLVTGRGGWPLSAWLTPEGKPFHVGTYFPKRSRQGMPGFLDLLEGLSEAWGTDREEIERRATQWTDAVRNRLEETPDSIRSREVPTSDVLESAAEASLRSADREYGGFGSEGPKFPQASRLHVLARAYDRTGREAYLDVVSETLDAMASGGLYDHVGGGFHRYCVDRNWTVPHFEKMLYDNADLPRAYLAGYQLTGEERYAEVVHETLAFVERELSHDEGGFFSTLDAESEDERGNREEGAFYVWTPEGVRDALDREALDENTGTLIEDEDVLVDLICARFAITESGNFEGKTVLNVDRSIEDLAAGFDLDVETVERRLESARERLFEDREGRPRPTRDEKVLAGWNGLMISAYAEAAVVLGEDAYAERAAEALEFIRETLWDGEALSRRFKDREVGIDGYLDDYAFLARGALHTYEATGDFEHLAFAVDLARVVEAEFWDDEHETLYFTPESGESLVTRPQELDDTSTPSSVGVAAEALFSVDEFVDAEYESLVRDLLETHGNRLEANPLQHATLCLVADRLETGHLEVTMAAESVPPEWYSAFGERYLPNRLLTRRPKTDEKLSPWLERLNLDDAPPIWAGREARDDEPTLYVCRNRTCSPPAHDVADAMAWIDE